MATRKGTHYYLSRTSLAWLMFLLGLVVGVIVTVILFVFFRQSAYIVPQRHVIVEKPAVIVKSVPTPIEKPIIIRTEPKHIPSPVTKVVPKVNKADEIGHLIQRLPEESVKVDADTMKPVWIQVGSFSKDSELQTMKARMLLLGYEAKTRTITKDDKLLLQVLIGPFTSKKHFNKAVEDLKKENVAYTFIY